MSHQGIVYGGTFLGGKQMEIMEESKFNTICREHSWADGYNPAAQNKFQKWLGNGCNHGMMWIFFGPGLLLAVIASIITICLCHNSVTTDIFGIYFLTLGLGLGIGVECVCSVERDKTFYNAMILKQTQLCFFKDKEAEYIEIST